MKPEDLKLANCWEGFAAVAIPEHAPQVQRDAMYEAFLAGCVTILQLHQACKEHRPANVHQVMALWRQNVEAELERLGRLKS